LCPIDCAGYWSDWTACSASCGNGTQNRTYIVTQYPANGGKPCDVPAGQVESKTCKLKECPVNCIGQWGSWGPCNYICDTGFCGYTSGYQYRTYSVLQAAAHGGTECPYANNATDRTTCTARLSDGTAMWCGQCPIIGGIGGLRF
jgi:hypothetical protein